MGGGTQSGSGEQVANVISFDLEHWYSATLLRDEVTDPADRIRTSVGIVLDMLAEHDTLATFFTVGEVAEEYPTLIGRIADAGHEVASHGHTHTPLFDLTRTAFAEELEASAEAIAAATGRRPIGFRAPNFSVTPRTQWAFDALVEAGYLYDSSVFPVKTPMYGVNGAPLHPYRVDPDAPFTDGSASANGLVEFPIATFHPRLRLPIAGGFYGRLLPTRLVEMGIRNLNQRGLPAMIYFHPWEFNPAVRTDEPPLHKRFISFHGLDQTRDVLDSLLATHEFGTCRQLFERYNRHERMFNR
ncbi:polysaccharide deacetylase family protein [Halalkalicoccus jeotgali]|nr:polysaccharide deacetylase family protein [Halalkalicoccus jeotgali]